MLFQLVLKQLAVVFLILASLPLAVTILWKLRLLPLALCLAATELFFPKWAASHETACLCLLAASVLFVLCADYLQMQEDQSAARKQGLAESV